MLYLTNFENRFACINSVCNGICGSVAFAAPALMSNTWFPPNQRATATAIGTFFVFMGVGMSFILGRYHQTPFEILYQGLNTMWVAIPH